MNNSFCKLIEIYSLLLIAINIPFHCLINNSLWNNEAKHLSYLALQMLSSHQFPIDLDTRVLEKMKNFVHFALSQLTPHTYPPSICPFLEERSRLRLLLAPTKAEIPRRNRSRHCDSRKRCLHHLKIQRVQSTSRTEDKGQCHNICHIMNLWSKKSLFKVSNFANLSK